MQASARQKELERLYNARRGHVPHISISDDSHHVTEAFSSYYETEEAPQGNIPHGSAMRDPRPLSYVPGQKETYDTRSRRQGTYLDNTSSNVDAFIASPPQQQRHASPPPQVRPHMSRARSSENSNAVPGEARNTSSSPRSTRSPSSARSLHRMGSLGADHGSSPPSSQPPPLSRQTSAETAVQQFPLNDIDYESSPAAVAQELSNLQAIRRMSMSVDTADPDLPSFGIPSSPPRQSDDENDPSKLFWVPARLHPELAPVEFKTFIEDRVDKIRRRSGGEDSLSPDGLERSGSGSSLRRKKSMLSNQIDTRGSYEDGAERLERKRSKGMHVEGHTFVENLADLETLVNDPAQLVQRMSLDSSRRSQDSGVEVSAGEDMPILPGGGSLKRSTRTTYRRGSLKKGERVPFSKRAHHRHTESDADESPAQSPTAAPAEEPEPILGLTRVQTEPIPPHPQTRENFSRPSQRRRKLGASQSSENLPVEHKWPERDSSSRALQESETEEEQQSPIPPEPQARRFQSRIASQGRTTAQLPGYNNTNPLPNIIETLPDGTKVPAPSLQQTVPDRKISHEAPGQVARGGAHLRPFPGQQTSPSSTLDDLSQHPSPLPGSGSTRTDALTMVPTFEEKKSEKKSSKKSGWKWILGNDDDDKDKKAKDDDSFDLKPKSGKLSKSNSADKARLDVLQTSIDGSVPARGRESLVLNREDIKIEEDRKPSKKSESKKESQPGLLSALFGGKKKSSDSDLKEKKRKSARDHSPEIALRILKPDIDYNWTRFSILEERAIYRMAHIKLANPRRALYSQVLLSNFMYSYLAKVQMMHPQIQIPPAQRASQQRGQQQSQQKKEESQQQQKPAELEQYQLWQEQQARADNASEQYSSNAASSSEMSASDSSQTAQTSFDFDEQNSASYDRHSSEEYGRHQQRPGSSSSTYDHSSRSGKGASAVANGGANHGGNGYSVASTYDYLGYRHDEKPFGHDSLWDEDDEKTEDLW